MPTDRVVTHTEMHGSVWRVQEPAHALWSLDRETAVKRRRID
jgi:hypothetical protein